MSMTDLQHIGIAALGALLLSAACIGAAVGPARAIETGPSYTLATVSAPISDEAHA